MLSGTGTLACLLNAVTKRSVAFRPMGMSVISNFTLHLLSSATQAVLVEYSPKPMVNLLSPVVFSSSVVQPPLGYISYFPVSGVSSTSVISGNINVLASMTEAMRLISRISDGSIQPATRFTTFLFLRVAVEKNFTMAAT
ncbi:hypothetical protein SDC9_159134 [bioreactor metagenome]|uniref:Uncharacterized protein n=1 Tax=bioreactor metagenome TaxID=1076179 RepID=A0A645FE04_9ZZZZ